MVLCRIYPVSDVLLSLLCRCDLLEEQLSDLTELHYSEIVNLKEELASMEDVAYQFYDGATDIHVSFTSHCTFFPPKMCPIARSLCDSFVFDL